MLERWAICVLHALSGCCLRIPMLSQPCVLQALNEVVKTVGHHREEPELYNHVDLVQLLDIVDLESGSTVAGIH